jgi:hypothetical protein
MNNETSHSGDPVGGSSATPMEPQFHGIPVTTARRRVKGVSELSGLCSGRDPCYLTAAPGAQSALSGPQGHK